MWEIVSIMLAVCVLLVIINYLDEPKQLFHDIKSLKGSDPKINELEARIRELEDQVRAIKRSNPK